jgi:hypothetical protein
MNMRFMVLGLTLAACLSPVDAMACIARTQAPDPDHPERYHQIFWGRVKSFQWTPGLLSDSDLTPPYTLELVAPATLLGPGHEGNLVRISAGCGWPRPEVGAMVILFVTARGHGAVPLYDDMQGSRIQAITAALNKSH